MTASFETFDAKPRDLPQCSFSHSSANVDKAIFMISTKKIAFVLSTFFRARVFVLFFVRWVPGNVGSVSFLIPECAGRIRGQCPTTARPSALHDTGMLMYFSPGNRTIFTECKQRLGAIRGFLQCTLKVFPTQVIPAFYEVHYLRRWLSERSNELVKFLSNIFASIRVAYGNFSPVFYGTPLLRGCA